MISVLLVHHQGAQFSLQFPEADGFDLLGDAPDHRYRVKRGAEVVAEVPAAATLYIGTTAMQFGAASVPAAE